MEKYNKTLVLNSSYLPLSIISSVRAFTIFYKGNADIIENHPKMFKHPTLELYKPSIIRIYSYIDRPYRKTPLTRENIYKRDDYKCVYCGETNRKLFTLDHVIPQAKGGGSTWENLVTACVDCNNEKSDLTLEEYGKEIPEPRRPHYLMLMKKTRYIPEEWKPYLLF